MMSNQNQTRKTTPKARRRFSPALAISFVSLFVALSGAAMALPGQNTVTSGDIVNETIKSVDLKDEKAVAGADVVDESLTGADLAAASVAGSEIADGSIDAPEVGDEIQPRTNGQLVGGGTGQNANYTFASATASCLAGEELISGSGHWANDGASDELVISEIQLDHATETVTVKGGNDSGANRTLVAVAHCL